MRSGWRGPDRAGRCPSCCGPERLHCLHLSCVVSAAYYATIDAQVSGARHRELHMRTMQAWAALLALLANGGAGASDPLPPGPIGMEPLPARTPHRIYLLDSPFPNEIQAPVST